FHIHTNLSACANPAMTLAAIVSGCERVGLESIGIADHLAPDGHERNAALLREIEKLDTPLRVYLGAEVGWAFKLGTHPMTSEQKETHGFQYAIGSHHSTYLKEYDLARIVELQHAHHLKTCEHPGIDVLGHPWRFLYEEFRRTGWPWINTMTCVPESMTRELGRAAVETGTAIEINTTSNLCMKFQPESYFEEYVAYLSVLAGEGVTFALGSDAHELDEFETIRLAWDVVDRLGIGDDRIWHPACPPANPTDRKDP
ncbi:MAG TPA: PHP domain-containing protein, partial [Planctomycetota bacterium]|nr:PHP domain-containing protein [Planctomycetota bacterium]